MTSSVQRGHHQFTAVKCREVWESKPVLQEIYSDLYRRIIRACRAVKIVEVGGGSEIVKQFSPDVISFGIVPLSWLDCIAEPSAYLLRSYSIGNLVLFDDLHHIEIPARFLANLLGVLLPGGRVIFVELAITPLSTMNLSSCRLIHSSEKRRIRGRFIFIQSSYSHAFSYSVSRRVLLERCYKSRESWPRLSVD